jgi:subtilisin-like proprotein convertase family protein
LQRGEQGIDINVTQLWAEYTGRGVIVAVNDDGMDLTHPDLVANVLPNLTFDAARGTTGQGFAMADNSHGTVVGGIIGMANNGIGGIGIAFDAKLVAGLSIAPKVGATNIDYAALFLANLASGAGVSCNSWGADPAFAENFGSSASAADQAWGAAMLRCVTEARGGLGMVIEVSGGNERPNNADTAMSNFTGARYTIAVGAVDHLGKVTSYSTPGASLLVTAPGGVGTADQSINTGFGIASADVVSDAGYNKTAGTEGDYSYQNEGTSYSGPMVAGVAALMLQANPKLGFRDVSTILAMTARQTDAENSSWVTTGGSTWNLGGMHFSRDYGFGLVDAKAVVHLAESWNIAAGTVANWKSAEAVVAAGNTVIPETTSGIALVASMATNISIERMEVLMELDATAPSQLRATLTSPSGTTITLFDGPLTRELVNGSPNMDQPESVWPGIFSVGATSFLGEQSAGTWTIALFDKVAGTTATFKSATVKAWGSESTPNTNLVFTDEFRGSKTLADVAGLDTINAAAMTGSVVINLNSGATSNLPNGQFVIAADTLIENAIGGDGNDTLIGNAANNMIRGNRGSDNIDGGAGTDTAVFLQQKSAYIVSKTATGFSVGSGGETDTLVSVERLHFANSKVAFDLDGSAGQTAKILGAVFGKASVTNKEYAGIGLSLLDGGMGYEQLAALAMNAAGKSASADVVNLLWTNLFGSGPSFQQAAEYVALLDNGQFSVGSLTVLAADTGLNIANINLVGLAQTGLDYI